MDCEGFDEVALDLIYDDGPHGQQLDEARRHADGCSRCSSALASLTQARQAIELPPMPVPPGLAASILSEVDRRERERAATWWGRIDRAVSFLGALAMRPQTAMGALLVLMTGLSLVLLRVKPAERGSVRITENGVPASEPAAPAAVAVASAVAMPIAPSRPADELPRAEAPRSAGARERDVEAKRTEMAADPAPAATAMAAVAAPTAAPAAPGAAAPAAAKAEKADTAEGSQEAAYAAAMDLYKARRYSDAVRAFDVVANGGGANGAQAALYAARATRYSSGCGAALPRFDAIATRQVSSVSSEATWEAALCYREQGQLDRARQLFSALRKVAGYRDRVEKELANIEQRTGGGDPPAAGAKAPR